MYVELSTGHQFIPDSVKSISPLTQLNDKYYGFDVVGIGYVVQIKLPIPFSLSTKKKTVMRDYWMQEIRTEFRQKLLPNLYTVSKVPTTRSELRKAA
jgi:hypothetical protein